MQHSAVLNANDSCGFVRLFSSLGVGSSFVLSY